MVTVVIDYVAREGRKEVRILHQVIAERSVEK